MAITAIPKNEVFQFGQFKAQIISLTTTGAGTHTIDSATLKSYGGPELNFSRIHAMFRFSTAICRVQYNLSSVNRIASLGITTSASAAGTILVIGE